VSARVSRSAAGRRGRVGVIDFQVLDLPGSDHRTIYAGLVVGNP
jgi:hypothetical protein